jgi:Skp family chaperone for outer membrane proteins
VLARIPRARFGAALWLLAALAPAAASAADATGYDETAACIAVIQTRSDDLVRQIKAGDKSEQAALHTELVRAAVLIGQAYLDGLHDERDARAMLQSAHDAQASWTEAQRHAAHDACVRKADAALAEASPVQRFIVERIAQARMNRLLASH